MKNERLDPHGFMSDIIHATALDLLQRLRRRELSSVELLDTFIARIERDDGAINAVIVRDFGRAHERARAADTALARGESGARCTACQ